MKQGQIDLKAELELQYDLVGHPKAGMLFALAWDYGHASGATDVRMYYSDLVELVR